MKVLVTGSEGYLGSVLTQVLVQKGHECTGVDTGFFRESVLYQPPSTKTLKLDARNINLTNLENFDVVIHLAGISNDPIGKLDQKKVYDPTREYSLKIAKMCKQLGIKFIFASSCSVYGIGGTDFFDEDSPVNPQTGYSINKVQIENDLKEISGNGFDPIALRFATVFGLSPRIRFDVVINMLVGMAFTSGRIVLNSDGQAWRPNLHILDLCDAVICAMKFDNRGQGLQILNIGSEENNLRILDIAKTVQASISGCELSFLSENPHLDIEGLIRDRKIQDGAGDNRTYRVSFRKVNKVLPNFRCDWDIARGVNQMIEGFRITALDYKKFKDRSFYRLQHLEHLLSAGLIDDNLSWK